MKSIVLELFRAHLSDPTLEVGIGKGTTTLQDLNKSRYGASFISARTFVDAMNALQDAGLMVLSTPHWHDPENKRSRVARYMATPNLISELSQTGASFIDLRRRENAEGIRLKDSNKTLIEYGDVVFTKEARERLRAINEMLSGHWADLALSDEQLAKEMVHIRGTRDEEATQSFDFAARTVYRVFNNNDWQQGGRFYGAWWISCPRRLRPHILIDGKRTVEVDYSGLHAAMLYAEAGLDVPNDPYARCLSRTGDKEERQLVKRTFNALLNADKVSRVSEIEGYTSDLTGRDWPEFKQYIVAQYPEFSQYFGSGVGLRLQRKDSDLAEAVMLQFAAMGYACLPVHDSFIVHHGLEHDLANAMSRAFHLEFGVDGKVGVEVGVGETLEGSSTPIGLDINDLLHPTGYLERLSKFWSTMGDR